MLHPPSLRCRSLSVSVVVDLFGPADLVNLDDDPATYVGKDSPPMLIVQGTADPLVPLSQSGHLAKALDAAGVESKLVVLEGAGHGGRGLSSTPERQGELVAFFRAHLARAQSPAADE